MARGAERAGHPACEHQVGADYDHSGHSAEAIARALGLIAGDLHADKICLSQWHPDRDLIETLAESGEQATDEFFPLDGYPLTSKVLLEQDAAQLLAEIQVRIPPRSS